MEFEVEYADPSISKETPIEEVYKKEIDDEDIWCVDIKTLDELLEFVTKNAKYDGIIIEKNEDIGELPRITIYNGYIE